MPISEEIIREIIDAFEKLNLGSSKTRVSVQKDDLENASKDETEDLSYLPDLVVFPDTAEEISAVMKIANKHRIPVTPRGAGTGLSGGAIPVNAGIVISLVKMDRIIEIDEENLFAVVEPGVITQKFQEAVEEKNLFYPPDPASKGSCTIGGNLAECSGGPRALKYGVTKDYIYGVEAVLPSGEIINTGGKLLKNVTGYNLTQLLIGSEGTLGIVTKLTIKLISLPKLKQTLMIPFPSIQAAAKTVPAVFIKGITPCAMEFMEGKVVRCAAEHLGKTFPNQEAEAQLLVELDGNDADQLMREAEIITEVAMENGAMDVLMADSEAKQNELWDIRRAAGEAVKSKAIYKEEDTVVPRARFPELMEGVDQVMKKYGLTAFCYGHAGDGNVHVNILKENVSDDAWEKELPIAIRELFEITVGLGGTISGEHGIGLVQKEYMDIALSEENIALQKRIKKAFDPENILNPNKIFP
jgi:glycolate oxidase